MPEATSPTVALADRNLLFGVLALQADLIDSSQFARACVLWSAQKHVPLEEVLVEQGWLSGDDCTDVLRLLERKLSKHGDDARASLAAVLGAEARRSLAGIADPDVQRSLAELPVRAGRVLVSTVAPRSESRQRYTLTHLHARGGIGQVWLAHDDEIGRDVALKELRPERGGEVALTARFLAEARITGQLEHPGIVPVYELSRRPGDDQPFYTMRFVKGRTLRDAIGAYHAKRQKGEARPLDLVSLLGAFVGVCNAVAYAHSRGVVHRDLKPQNVVLGDFGEVIVLDWGLAKLVEPDRPNLPADSETPTVAEAPPPVQMGREFLPDATIQGQVLGTPAYMAPEQASGRIDLVDPLTDVYGLGAMLYEVLTGAPPFPGDDTQDVLRKVQQEEPARPRERVGTVSRALEAVCLKALAKKRGARYSSAVALAQDVQHWLADEPVSACRDRLATRFARWSRRHRVLVASAALLLLAAVVSLGALSFLIDRERRRTDQARADADASAVLADLRRQEAEQARQKEKEQRQQADRLRHRAEEALYFNRIAFADRERAAGNALQAEQLLDSCPAERRHWEWHFLRRLCRVEQRTLAPGIGPMNAVARSPDGRLIAAGSGRTDAWGSGTIHLWDLETGKTVRLLRGHGWGVVSVEFSPDGKQLVSAARCTDWTKQKGEDGTFADVVSGEVRIWDLTTGWTRLQLPGYTCIAFDPDRRYLAAGNLSRKQVILWDPKIGGKPIWSVDLPGVPWNLRGSVSRTAFSGGRELDK
jgi:serine/threonine protein kinase